MKLHIWTNFPNHYQAALFSAIRSRGVNLTVGYYSRVPADRRAMMWNASGELPDGECWMQDPSRCLDDVPDGTARIHVLPVTHGASMLRLAIELSRRRVPWIHWSEPFRSKPHSLIRAVRLKLYVRLINDYALGAFGVGRRAMDSFVDSGVAREKVALLPYTAPPVDTRSEPDEAVARFLLGRLCFVYLGSLCRRKATDVLLEAFRGVVSLEPDVALVLVGPRGAGEPDYAKTVQRFGLSEHVLLRGPVSPAQVGSVLALSSVLVLPSRYDGWGVALAEGASSGLALIGSDAVGASDHLIAPGVNGFVVAAGDEASLRRALLAYARNRPLAERHGEASRQQFDRYSPAAGAARVVDAINSWQGLRWLSASSTSTRLQLRLLSLCASVFPSRALAYPGCRVRGSLCDFEPGTHAQ